MHGDDDQIVPYADAGPLSAKLVKGAILKTYKGFCHGMHTTNADTINEDLLGFIKSLVVARPVECAYKIGRSSLYRRMRMGHGQPHNKKLFETRGKNTIDHAN